MGEQQQLLQEQISYYRARAPEYDDWWFRRGRYDRGANQRQTWNREILELERALDATQPAGTVLELACATGIWTDRLVRRSARLVAIDASPEVLAINAKRVQNGLVEYIQADLFDWQPRVRFDFVFFAFWLSHVPPDQFDIFWEKVAASLKPDGVAFFIDSPRAEESTACNHVLAQGGDPITSRKLDDGREFRIFKIFYEPAALQQRLAASGWRGEIHLTGKYFIYGSVQHG